MRSGYRLADKGFSVEGSNAYPLLVDKDIGHNEVARFEIGQQLVRLKIAKKWANAATLNENRSAVPR
jgi:hypothetical protein